MANPYYVNNKTDGEIFEEADLEAIETGFDGVESDIVIVEANTVAGDALALKIASDLSDLNSAVTSRTNLGLGTAAVEDIGNTIGDAVGVIDVGAGVAGLPVLDGQNITNLPTVTDVNIEDTNNGMALMSFFASF